MPNAAPRSCEPAKQLTSSGCAWEEGRVVGGGLVGPTQKRDLGYAHASAIHPSCGRVAGRADDWAGSPVLGSPQKTKMAKSMISKCWRTGSRRPSASTGPGQQREGGGPSRQDP